MKIARIPIFDSNSNRLMMDHHRQNTDKAFVLSIGVDDGHNHEMIKYASVPCQIDFIRQVVKRIWTSKKWRIVGV